MILITGASGQLGRLVIDELIKHIPATEIVAAVRKPNKVEDLAKLGIQIRQADYNNIDTLIKAFDRIDKILFISSSEIGQRCSQHANVIAAAKQANINFIAYTSLLHADTSPLALAEEHKQTEQMLKDSGLAHAILRNGWYSENYTAGIPTVVLSQTLIGCAGEGRISSASRRDYAAAASAILLSSIDQAGKIYELAGDDSFTLNELAEIISSVSGQQISYQAMTELEYQQALVAAGLPLPVAQLLADSETGAKQGGLFDDSHQLRQLIGRSTTSIKASVQQSL